MTDEFLATFQRLAILVFLVAILLVLSGISVQLAIIEHTLSALLVK